MKRIGIYAGTFNPIHAGHIAFALQAKDAAALDELWFLPERKPRYKSGVEHFGHRVAMIRTAIKPYRQFKILELPDVSFSIAKTLPALQKTFADAQLVFLFGSDVVPALHRWPHIEQLFRASELVIGLRQDDEEQTIKHTIERWPSQPIDTTLFTSYAADVSSTKIRQALLHGEVSNGLLRSVQKYSNHHWLYVSVSAQ